MNLNFDKILCVFPPCGNTHILVGNFRHANDNGVDIEGTGKLGIGALRIGTVKNDVQKKIVKKLFEKKGQVIGLEDIYAAAFE